MFLYIALLILLCVPVHGYFDRGHHTFVFRGSNGKRYPLTRSPLRFVGKRLDVKEESYNADSNGSSIDDKRQSQGNAETKLKILEKILFDLRTIEVEQDKEFRTILEKHKYQIRRLFELLPPYVDRRLFHSFLSSLIKRRFNAWGGKRSSSKRPSFNAWGGRKKRSNIANDELSIPYTGREIGQEEFMKRQLDGDLGFMKRPSFNAWGGKRSFNDPGSLIRGSMLGNPDFLSYNEPTKAQFRHTLKLGGTLERHSDNIANVEDQFEDTQKRGFNAWGGKREETGELGNKRANFNPWGGKRDNPDSSVDIRSGFNAWGGKRLVSKDVEIDEENERRWPPSFINIEFDNLYPTE